MERKSVKLSADSAEDCDDPKDYVMAKLPGIVSEMRRALEKAFDAEIKAGKITSEEYAHDRAIEIAGEISDRFRVEPVGELFEKLLDKAFKLSQSASRMKKIRKNLLLQT